MRNEGLWKELESFRKEVALENYDFLKNEGPLGEFQKSFEGLFWNEGLLRDFWKIFERLLKDFQKTWWEMKDFVRN